MANLNLNRRRSLSLSDLGSMPNLTHIPRRHSPIFVVSRFYPQSAPSATTTSTESVPTEIELLDIENGPDESKNLDPTEILGTLRMHYHDVSSWSPSYLQTFFKITNFTGFTPYRFSMHNQMETFGNMVPFIVISSLNTLYSCRLVKSMLLEAPTKSEVPDIRFYIILLRNIVQAILRISAIRTFLKGKKISSTLDKMDATSFSSLHNSKLKFYITTSVMCTSFMLGYAGSLIVPDIFGTGWTVRSLLEFRSKEVESFFVARSDNDTTEILFRDLTDKLGVKTVIMGSFGCIINFVGVTLDQLIRLAVLFSTLTLKECVDEFNYEDIPVGLEVGIVASPKIIGEQIQIRYNELKRTSKAINDLFGGVIELLLLESLLMLSDVFATLLNAHYGNVAKILCFSEALTILTIFYFAVSISTKISNFRDWLTSEFGPEKAGITKDDVNSILQELATNPIGVGRDSLYTNKRVFIGFFGIATGYFFSTVETRSSVCNCGYR